MNQTSVANSCNLARSPLQIIFSSFVSDIAAQVCDYQNLMLHIDFSC